MKEDGKLGPILREPLPWGFFLPCFSLVSLPHTGLSNVSSNRDCWDPQRCWKDHCFLRADGGLEWPRIAGPAL